MSLWGAASHAIRGTVRAGERVVGARDDAGDQQQAQGAAQAAAQTQEWANATPEQRAEQARAAAYAAGPTYLEKWESVMPTSYNLGGDPNAANAYAAQAQQTGQQAQQYLDQAAQQSQGVGYTFGQNLADAGARAEQYGQDVGGATMGYGQQQAQALGQMGQGFQQQGAAMSDRSVGQPRFGAMNDSLNAANPSFGAMNRNLDASDPNFAAQNRSLGRAGQNAAALQGIEAQEGPSAAQAQLQSGLNQSQASNLALARSGRGWGGSAGAMAQAQSLNAAAGQGAANQSAALRAQENAAYRSRAAANLGASAGINLGAGQQQLGQQQLDSNAALQRAGMNLGQQQLGSQVDLQKAGMQLGQQQLGSSAALQQQAQNDAAQQGLYGLGLNAQQSAAQTGLAGLTQGAAIGQQGLAQNMQGQQAGGEMQMSGLGQSGQLAQAGAMVGLAAQQQAAAVQQQQVANNMGYQNQMLSLHQGNQNVQSQQAALNAQQSQFDKGLTAQYINGTMQAIGTGVGALSGSDRNMKKDIEPTNGSVLIPPTDTSGMGGPGGYEFGTGISGPNQMQGGQASEQAAMGASASSQGAADEAERQKAFGAAKKGLQGVSINAPQPLQIQPRPFYSQPISVPQPMYPQLSDRNEKTGYAMSDEDAKEAIDETPGYSYRYKDPEAMGATDGMQFGVMAQDLEKTPAGRSVVKKQPDGTRMVDTSRLALLEAGAMNALSKEVAEIKKMLGRAKGKAA